MQQLSDDYKIGEVAQRLERLPLAREVVGLSPSPVYWMDIFHVYLL